MKKDFLLLFVIYFSCACGNNKADESATGNDTVEATPLFYRWEATDSNGMLEMKRVEDEGPGALSPAEFVTYLNKVNSDLQLVLIKTSGDTIYLKIPDASYLTEQQGSAGATMILAELVYNLTEIPAIRYVNLDFEAGDHAAPGTFDRDTFKNK